MAFSRKNLAGNMGAGSGAPKVYSFVDSASTLAQITAADYFLTAHDVLDAGDIIQVLGSDGAATIRVSASSSTTVTTAVATAAGFGGVAAFGPAAVTSITIVNGIVTAIA